MERITSPDLIRNTAEYSGFFDYLPYDALSYAQLHRFDANEFILSEGQIPDYFYLVAEGQAKAYLTHSNGKVSLVNFLYAPCFIGEMELLNAQQKAVALQAMIPVTCIALPMQQCRKSLLQNPVFLRELCIYLSKKADRNSRIYTHNIAYPLENRLARFIQITVHNEIYSERHTEASEYLGVTYRHLLYVIASFVQRGILQKTNFGYKIINHEALKQLASQN
ncbi:transcriptional regulator YeiL [Pelosinus propionicus]|uniref:CRP/FNR family transcriptional regulator, putaive post-exponential-phase nitrogen-starvation regulator n=1 Tax=Pelosinus propionicus DSM 13327 TaxID=1123291 RepID=A0A1I4PHN5_9FIRM|nr:transcriptional regulator YeiL [Pelosinus propionicus]SFM27268.1 CRP/FNR family transcriptional regulator, putaive post-exponential-phase nitrogen-starvation regulator [Pelosinus propionicus DSM 13327]